MEVLHRLGAEAAQLRTRLEGLSRQVASGRRAESLGELAPYAPRAISLGNDIARRETYIRALDQAAGRMSVMQASLNRLAEIAREFRAEVAMRLTSRDENALVTVRARARAALIEVGHLLNTRLDGEYLFAGSDIANPPIPDPESLPDGGMASAIAAAVAGLDDSNAAAVAAATRAAAQSTAPGISPFSDFLEDPARGGGEPRRSLLAADGARLAYGIHANRNAMATSEGETTGAWVRDLLRGLMTLAALTPAQAAYRQGFEELATVIRAGLAAAEEGLAEERGALGAVQRQAEAERNRHRLLSDTLAKQLAQLTEVDLAETLTRLQATRQALEASYRATATLAELTLTRFLR
ncbi:MAG: flagellin [Rhodovarius sp.]|nr:flagellin [Rhodovarius sp.]MCX7932088.1 flagellin [Rhodovarius sp.]MDW8315921.1 flagellin [Rhodovarius sp.]